MVGGWADKEVEGGAPPVQRALSAHGLKEREIGGGGANQEVEGGALSKQHVPLANCVQEREGGGANKRGRGGHPLSRRAHP